MSSLPATYSWSARMEAVTQLSIVVPNAPSSLAKVGDRLRSANVNISAITCTEGHPNTTIHLIVDDSETAKIVLKELGHVSTHDVIALVLKNKPGAIAAIARECAAAGINIHNIYTTTYGKETMLYVDADDAKGALSLLKAWKASNVH